MKKLLILSLIFTAFSANAQDPDPDLFGQTWYLYQIYDSDFNEYFYVEGWQPYGGEPTIPQIAPYVIIDASLNFNGLGICNTFEGTLEYSGLLNSFRTTATSRTTDVCGFYEDMAEPYLIGPFGFVNTDPSFYTIVNPNITDDADGFQTLRYETQPFVSYTYRNTPILSGSDFETAVFAVYPNPTHQYITIVSSNVIAASVSVYSVSGKLVATYHEATDIDLSQLNNGLYFVQIESENIKEVHKILKK